MIVSNMTVLVYYYVLSAISEILKEKWSHYYYHFLTLMCVIVLIYVNKAETEGVTLWVMILCLRAKQFHGFQTL